MCTYGHVGLGYDVESISYCRPWCKKEVPALQSPGWSVSSLPPSSSLISYLFLLCLSPRSHWPSYRSLKHVVLTYTKGLPAMLFFCGDSPVPWLTPTISQTSHESTFPRETCWDLPTRSSPSSHAFWNTIYSLTLVLVSYYSCDYLSVSPIIHKGKNRAGVPFCSPFILVSFMCAFYYRIRRW